jgi:hypothetical protein
VTDKTVTAIEMLRVDTVQIPHAPPEFAVDGFDHLMVVIRHLAVGVGDKIA